MNDGLLPEDDPIVRLEVFEGPLDLLLHLVKQSEVNILDLPMETITRQYLSTLRAMGKLELPVAGEYFVMAAELLKIKSQMLLPRGGALAGVSSSEEASHGPDPRADLVRQLLEYQHLKEQSAVLERQIDRQALSYACLKTVAPAERPLKEVERFELMGAYALMMRRLLERVAVGEIMLDPHTVSDAIDFILKNLPDNETQTFGNLLKNGPQAIGWMAAMFVALLELTRLGEITLTQEEHCGEITLSRRLSADKLAV